ncbi:PIN domain-containing protein [Nautilia lithotrophica]
MKMIVDAAVVLDFLIGKDKVVSKFKLAEELFVTIFDYSLLIAGVYKTQNINHNLYIVKEFIKQNMEILYFEKKEAMAYAKLKIDYPDIDDIILMKASIIQTNSLPFFTYNSIYEKIKKIKLLKD